MILLFFGVFADPESHSLLPPINPLSEDEAEDYLVSQGNGITEISLEDALKGTKMAPNTVIRTTIENLKKNQTDIEKLFTTRKDLILLIDEENIPKDFHVPKSIKKWITRQKFSRT